MVEIADKHFIDIEYNGGIFLNALFQENFQIGYGLDCNTPGLFGICTVLVVAAKQCLVPRQVQSRDLMSRCQV